MDSTTIMFVYQIPKDILKAEFPFNYSYMEMVDILSDWTMV